MEAFYALPFAVLRPPSLKLKAPRIEHPPAFAVFGFIVFSYFLITGGIIYDIIVEPPSIGQTVDEHGNQKPVAFMQYRINGQYIVEGLSAASMFVLGAGGFMILDKTNAKTTPTLTRFILITAGLLSIAISLLMCRVFIRMKLPGYLQE